jgi:hypothetical protein
MFETGVSFQAVQRELGNLGGFWIVKKQETYNRVYYQVNSAPPLFKQLKEIRGLGSGEKD